MTRCLSDRTLVLLYHGEGPEAAGAHVTTCLRCAARSQELRRELEIIGQALRQPPPMSLPTPAASAGRRWAVAAALAALALLGVGEVWLWQTSRSLVAARPETDAEAVAFLEEVSAFLSGTDDGGPTAVPVLGLGDVDRSEGE